MTRALGTLALSGLMALTGCAALDSLLAGRGVRPARPAPTFEQYRDAGPLPVFGEQPSQPGPRIYAEVLQIPRLTAFLRQHGVPDTLEVRDEAGRLRVVLTYTRKGNRPQRRIVVERVEDRFTAYAPTRLDGRPLYAPRPPESTPATVSPQPLPEERIEGESEAELAPESEPEPVPESAPAAETTFEPRPEVPLATELQILECPIDPEREDCADLCTPGAPYEWCF